MSTSTAMFGPSRSLASAYQVALDPEPKFGLSVIGEVDPGRLLRNNCLRPNDALVLSKALGTGVISTAAKAGEADGTSVTAMIASMCRTNAEAAAAALDAGAVGATDVTGYGLLGHLGQMAQASGVGVYLDTGAVPLLPGARELASRGYVPGGTQRNLAWIRDRLDVGMVGEVTLTLLADAQTSGGLVFGVAPDRAAEVTGRLRGFGHDAAVIGYATHVHDVIRLVAAS